MLNGIQKLNFPDTNRRYVRLLYKPSKGVYGIPNFGIPSSLSLLPLEIIFIKCVRDGISCSFDLGSRINTQTNSTSRSEFTNTHTNTTSTSDSTDAHLGRRRYSISTYNSKRYELPQKSDWKIAIQNRDGSTTEVNMRQREIGISMVGGSPTKNQEPPASVANTDIPKTVSGSQEKRNSM